MKKTITIISLSTLIIFAFGAVHLLQAKESLAKRLVGRILLQVESHGDAWYVNPGDSHRYLLGRPDNALNLMSKFGVGITNADLTKIPVGIISYNTPDDDQDGLSNNLETSIGTDPQKADSDGDGYDDKTEIENNYNPVGKNKISLDPNFTKQNSGRIFLQVEDKGQAWYINPADKKRYFLNRPADALVIMQKLSLGISNKDIEQIAISYIDLKNNNQEASSTPSEENNNTPAPAPIVPQITDDAEKAFQAAASAIRSGDKAKALTYFTPDMQKAVDYTMDFLDYEAKFTLGNMMAGAKLSQSAATKKTFSTTAYFSMGGYNVPIKYYVEKQADGKWLLSNL